MQRSYQELTLLVCQRAWACQRGSLSELSMLEQRSNSCFVFPKYGETHADSVMFAIISQVQLEGAFRDEKQSKSSHSAKLPRSARVFLLAQYLIFHRASRLH